MRRGCYGYGPRGRGQREEMRRRRRRGDGRRPEEARLAGKGPAGRDSRARESACLGSNERRRRRKRNRRNKKSCRRSTRSSKLQQQKGPAPNTKIAPPKINNHTSRDESILERNKSRRRERLTRYPWLVLDYAERRQLRRSIEYTAWDYARRQAQHDTRDKEPSTPKQQAAHHRKYCK